MSVRVWLAPMVAVLLMVSVVTSGVARAQVPGESYWGEHTLNGLFQTWPLVALVVLGVVLAGGMFGIYELDVITTVLLLAGLAYLAYHLYRYPVHLGSSVRRLSTREPLALS